MCHGISNGSDGAAFWPEVLSSRRCCMHASRQTDQALLFCPQARQLVLTSNLVISFGYWTIPSMAAALYKQTKDVEISGSEAVHAHLLNLGPYPGGPSLRTWDTCLNPRPPTGSPVRESIRRQRSLCRFTSAVRRRSSDVSQRSSPCGKAQRLTTAMTSE